MKYWKIASVIIGVIAGILTTVWVAMQIFGWDGAAIEVRPLPGKLCYLFQDGHYLPKGTVVTNTIGGEAMVDEFSRFSPLDSWTIGTELNVWTACDASGKRMHMGTTVLTARRGEWVRIDLHIHR